MYEEETWPEDKNRQRGLGRGMVVIVVSRGVADTFVHQVALIQFRYRVETGRICHHDPGQEIVHKQIRQE